MDSKNVQNIQKSRFLKLSLKKNRLKLDTAPKTLNRSSDAIIIDESFDRLKPEFSKNVQAKQKIYSPIIINDSCELSLDEDLPKIVFSGKEPSKMGNISFNSPKEATEIESKRPSIGGWSPAEIIIRTTPKHDQIPSTPKDTANESYEQCSMKKIQQSQKKLLSDLYGETWKSIPTLFKTITHGQNNLNGVSKKLRFDDDESDKENIRYDLEINKKLYLTGSGVKKKSDPNPPESERKSKKKLYTEKIPNTPEVPQQKSIRIRNVNSTTKKVKVTKGMSVTELVEVLKKDVESLTRKVENATVKSHVENEIQRLSFVGSLADNVPSWRCNPEALQYRDNYKNLREQLTRRLYSEFNKVVFDSALGDDMPILWDSKLRSTAGTTTNRLIKNAKGDRIRTSSIKLCVKVCDSPGRLRDTLVHEMCHAATWLVDGELRAGHGPLWKQWATRALRLYPELGEISRCHDMQIHFKYSYKCTKCGYSIHRHSKSIDITKKCCGYCRGTFEIRVNKKNKDGVVVSTPARKGNANEFAAYVKENYATFKNGTTTHAQVMKTLGEQFSAKKATKNL